jgi:transcription-repair coupling factor (superfamily II helicase)
VTKILHEQFGDRLKVAIAHGKTPVDELERIMMGFANGEFSCLISTAIIESGIDIPMANTLIVNSAHLFGLADLHQLRGRVGRLDRQAYAYFLYPQGEILGQDAVKRLEYIEDYANLGAGFDIAMRDLELRGAGNIIGPEQHGFIFQIGLDLYCRLLRAEIERQKTLPKTDNGTQSEEKGSSI